MQGTPGTGQHGRKSLERTQHIIVENFRPGVCPAVKSGDAAAARVCFPSQ